MSKSNNSVTCPPSPTNTCDSSIVDVLPVSHGHKATVPRSPCLEESTLYDRLGGEPNIKTLTAVFFEEIAKVEGLAHFFVNVPVAAIQLHQGQFFKVLFGADEEKPSADELLDYMIVTHVRLFRDLGLDASHFDMVANCFVAAMNQMKVPANLQYECLAIVGPLRVAFDYGATVARQERKMSQEALKTAPLATVKTMRADSEAKLPAGLEPPPQWLVDFLDGRDNVRAWTCALTYRLLIQDEVLKEIFFNLAYLEMEPYCDSLLQLAFSNQMGNEHKLPLTVLRTVRFPCGLRRASLQLTKTNFQRIVNHFFEVGIELGQKQQSWLMPDELMEITDSLREKSSMFVGTEPTSRMSTLERHHRLRNDQHKAPQMSLEQQLLKKEKTYAQLKNKSKNKSSSVTFKKHETPEQQKSKGSWFLRLGGKKKENDKNISSWWIRVIYTERGT